MPSFTVFNLFTLLCGIALFLYGMQQGEKNLKKLGAGRLRQMVGAITRHRIAAYGTGFITTLVTQSSSATTVLLVGFASARLMTLRQSLGVILGSDLGTTVTVQLFAFRFYLVSPLLIALGFAISLFKKSGPLTLVGKLVLAAGFVFFGMQLMTEASAPLQSYPLVARLLQQCFSDIWTGLAVGMLLTVIFQSSAATLVIAMTLAANFTFAHGEAPGPAGFLPVVLGANIGTCSTAFLALLEAKEEGVRVAWAHLLFKVCGAALALPFVWLLPGAVPAASGISPAIQIAALHTGFNLYISAIFLPLLPLVDRLIRRLIVPAPKEGLRFRTQFLHDNVLPFPALALPQAAKEISRMSDMVVRMVEESADLIRRYELRTADRIMDKDDEVDFLHERIMTFLTQIAREELGPDEASRSYELIM
ncbi:MAG: Na/Pi cotransporter family protein, partial [Chitinispirillaceae bacterium]|nr:Na/Pi cotransporter family protein [Chitinispirillaceae bacterium]